MLATSWRVLVGDVAVVGDGKNWKLAGKEPLGQPWPERAGSVHCDQVQLYSVQLHLVLSGHVVVLYMMVHHGDVSPKLF